MKSILRVIERAQREFGLLLEQALDVSPLTSQQYQRYLTMQYHLTRESSRTFCARQRIPISHERNNSGSSYSISLTRRSNIISSLQMISRTWVCHFLPSRLT